jgi:pilus assembly protein CpaE
MVALVGQMTRIVIATADEASRNLIRRVAAQHHAGRVVGEVETEAALVDAVSYRHPRLVFVSTELTDKRGFEAANQLSRRYPGLYIVMVSPHLNNVDDLRSAMKAGARECLFEPLSEASVLRVLEEAQSMAAAVVERRGPVVSVLSSKGGVGKSTVALNLAIALKQLGVRRVALADGDLFFGDIAVLLDLKPERTIHELNAALDAEIADRFLYTHSTGIEVLAAPLRAEQAEEISAERFREILGILQGLYDAVVVDSSVSAFDALLAALDVADLAIVLTTLDVVCLKDVSQVVDMLGKLRFPLQNVLLVGNRYDERLSLTPKEAEKAVGLQFAAVLPRDDRVVLSANRGMPMLLAEPNTPFSQKIRALAKVTGAQLGRLNHVAP